MGCDRPANRQLATEPSPAGCRPEWGSIPQASSRTPSTGAAVGHRHAVSHRLVVGLRHHHATVPVYIDYELYPPARRNVPTINGTLRAAYEEPVRSSRDGSCSHAIDSFS